MLNTFTPTIGREPDAFLTHLQRAEAHKKYQQQLEEQVKDPKKIDTKGPYAHFKKIFEDRFAAESQPKDKIATISKMVSMMNVMPDVRIAAHKPFHEHFLRIALDMAKYSGKKEVDRKPEDLKSLSNLAADLGRESDVLADIGGPIGMLGIGLAGAGLVFPPLLVPAGYLSGIAGGIGLGAAAYKVLQAGVLALDPNAPEGSAKAAGFDGFRDLALAGLGSLGGRFIKHMNLKAIENAYTTVRISMSRVVQIMTRSQLYQRISSIYVQGRYASAQTLKKIDLMFKRIEAIANMVTGSVDIWLSNSPVVEHFLKRIGDIGHLALEGVTNAKDFLFDSIVRGWTMLATGTRNLIRNIIQGANTVADAVADLTRRGILAVASGGRRVLNFGISTIRRGRQMVGRAIHQGFRVVRNLLTNIGNRTLDILQSLNLIRRNVLHTGEVFWEWASDQIADYGSRILEFVRPGVEFTLGRITELVGIAERIFGPTARAGVRFVSQVIGIAGSALGMVANRVGGLLSRITNFVGGGVRSIVSFAWNMTAPLRSMGSALLERGMAFAEGLLDRFGPMISGGFERSRQLMLGIWNSVTGIAGSAINRGRDFLTRLTDKGASGFIRLVEGAAGIGRTVTDFASGVVIPGVMGLATRGAQWGADRLASFADRMVSGGVRLGTSLASTGEAFFDRAIRGGSRVGMGVVNIVERMMTRPLQRALPYLPEFATPLANRYLRGAGAIGNTARNLIDRFGTGGRGILSRIGTAVRGGIGFVGGLLGQAIPVGRGLLDRLIRGTAARATERSQGMLGRMSSFITGMASRLTTGASRIATGVSNIVNNPIGTARNVVGNVAGIAQNTISSTGDRAHSIVSNTASMLGASASNPVATVAHSAINIAERVASAGTGLLSSAADSVLGWLQRDGTGPEKSVKDPIGFANQLKGKENQVHLDPKTKGMLSEKLGFDLSSTKLHAGPESGKAASSLGAKAFTIGDSVFFGEGQYAPGTEKGMSLLAHELTHVVQQTGGVPSTQKADDANGGEMERAAQAEGQSMVLAMREAQQGGIDAHEMDIRRQDGSLVSDEDRDRLKGIEERMKVKVREKAAAAGITRIVSSTVEVNISLDLESTGDDEAAEIWATAVIASVRTTQEPVRNRTRKPIERKPRAAHELPEKTQVAIEDEEDPRDHIFEPRPMKGPMSQKPKTPVWQTGIVKVTPELPRHDQKLHHETQDVGLIGKLLGQQDDKIRESVGKRSMEEMAKVPATQRIQLVNQLLDGWIADEDVDAAAKLLQGIQSEKEVREVQGGIQKSLDAMFSARQKARLDSILETTLMKRSKPEEHAKAVKEIEDAQRMASFAKSAYGEVKTPENAIHLDVDKTKLPKELQDTVFHDEKSGFDASLYRDTSTTPPKIVIAFRGTHSGADWKNNLTQGMGLEAEQYKRAVELAEKVQKSYKGEQIEVTGHSLGGGLATIAAAKIGVKAITFNAANVHADNFKNFGVDPAKIAKGSVNYQVAGEPLSKLQRNAEGLGRVGGGILGLGVGPSGGALMSVLGGMMASKIVKSPLEQKVLEARTNEGGIMGAVDMDSIDGHGMDSMVQSLKHRNEQLKHDKTPVTIMPPGKIGLKGSSKDHQKEINPNGNFSPTFTQKIGAHRN